MNSLAIRLVVAVLSVTLAGSGLAADPADAPAPKVTKGSKKATAKGGNLVKAGDPVYVCGCGPGCKCNTIQAKPGKCGCGSPLVKAQVTKVEGDQVSVKIPAAKEEQVFKAPYKCACGGGCNCSAALGPGKCACGKELVKNE